MRNIPPDLLEKIKKQNQTIYENADPKMSIQVSRAKTTVTDSTYWTVETIRMKEGLGDTAVAARRFKPHGGPNRLYNIYVDNGMVKTAIREYPDYQENKWQTQFSIEEGTAVAIAFDGEWQRWRKRWHPITVENPHLFWVNNSGELYVQVWDNEETRYKLDEDVVKVKALRGWKNVNYKEVDQGIVCAYIKTDGSVWYCNYAWSSLISKYVWSNPIQIEDFDISSVNINLFITNDYRLGIIVEDVSGKIHWVITDRAWAGMAIAPDKFLVRAKATVKFIEIKYWGGYSTDKFDISTEANVRFLYAGSFNLFKILENIAIATEDYEEDYGQVVHATTRYRLCNLNAADFMMTDSEQNSYGCVDILELTDESSINNWKYEMTFVNFNAAENDLTIKCLSQHTKNEAGYLFDIFEGTFTAIELDPSKVKLPEPEVIWNE